MKVLFKSFYLYFLGLAAEYNRHALESAVLRAARRGERISGKRLTRLSDRSYRLYRRFKTAEENIKRYLDTAAV